LVKNPLQFLGHAGVTGPFFVLNHRAAQHLDIRPGTGTDRAEESLEKGGVHRDLGKFNISNQ
jgi:hypothetical protein